MFLLPYLLPILIGASAPTPRPAPTTYPAAASHSADPAPRVGFDVATALRTLSPSVTESSRPEALETAFTAYYRYRAERPARVRQPYLYFVDFGLDARTPRGWVFDMERLELVEGPFNVAHGSGSSTTRYSEPTIFSNQAGSHASSLGLYVTRETYRFRGKAAGRIYESVGLRLRGESGRFNDAAEARGIVVHGAPYVTSSAAGRSQGCPAIEPERAKRLLPLLAGGSVVFVYSPNDELWLREGPWLSVLHRAEGEVESDVPVRVAHQAHTINTP